jgi:hypothetical protein
MMSDAPDPVLFSSETFFRIRDMGCPHSATRILLVLSLPGPITSAL